MVCVRARVYVCVCVCARACARVYVCVQIVQVWARGRGGVVSARNGAPPLTLRWSLQEGGLCC